MKRKEIVSTLIITLVVLTFAGFSSRAEEVLGHEQEQSIFVKGEDSDKAEFCLGAIPVNVSEGAFYRAIWSSQAAKAKINKSTPLYSRIEDLKEWFRRLDKDGDGYISFEEIINADTELANASSCPSCNDSGGCGGGECHCHQNTGQCGPNGDGALF